MENDKDDCLLFDIINGLTTKIIKFVFLVSGKFAQIFHYSSYFANKNLKINELIDIFSKKVVRLTIICNLTTLI